MMYLINSNEHFHLHTVPCAIQVPQLIFFFSESLFCRYQIVVEIIHATTISSLPQLKKQKGAVYKLNLRVQVTFKRNKNPEKP